jgi:hypothetical protein
MVNSRSQKRGGEHHAGKPDEEDSGGAHARIKRFDPKLAKPILSSPAAESLDNT